MKQRKLISLTICSLITAVMVISYNTEINPFSGVTQRRYERLLGSVEDSLPKLGKKNADNNLAQKETQSLSDVIIKVKLPDFERSWAIRLKKKTARDLQQYRQTLRLLQLLREAKFFHDATSTIVEKDLNRPGVYVELHFSNDRFAGYLPAQNIAHNLPVQNFLQLADIQLDEPQDG